MLNRINLVMSLIEEKSSEVKLLLHMISFLPLSFDAPFHLMSESHQFLDKYRKSVFCLPYLPILTIYTAINKCNEKYPQIQ